MINTDFKKISVNHDNHDNQRSIPSMAVGSLNIPLPITKKIKNDQSKITLFIVQVANNRFYKGIF